MIDAGYHGSGGPLSVSTKSPLNRLATAFVSAAASAGHTVGDYNGEKCRVGHHQFTVRNGMRCSAASAYIDPVRDARPNLTVRCDAHVARVVLEKADEADLPRAAGVELLLTTKKILVSCRKEVILCAGAVGTPHILLLSGVGPRNQLATHGIECIVDSPGVGQHMQDHLVAVMRFSPKEGQGKQDIGTVNANKAEGPLTALPNILRMWLGGRGMLTSSGYDASLFLRTKGSTAKPGNGAPDLQLSIFVSGGDKAMLQGNFGLPLEGLETLNPKI